MPSGDDAVSLTRKQQNAWDRNVKAIQSTKAAMLEARQAQAQVETVAGDAARQRAREAGARIPVLTDGEIAAVQKAREKTLKARQALELAKARFKAAEGVV
jgi:hypothetical protein